MSLNKNEMNILKRCLRMLLDIRHCKSSNSRRLVGSVRLKPRYSKSTKNRQIGKKKSTKTP